MRLRKFVKPANVDSIDTPELIKKCLSCKKKECTNCIYSMTSKERTEYRNK